MKRNSGFWKHGGLLMTLLLLACSVFGIGGVGGAITAEAGTVTYGEPISFADAWASSPEIVKAVIEREVVVIKPHLTPLYTLGSNRSKVTTAKSRVIHYDEMEASPLSTTVATAYTGVGNTQDAINFANNKLIAINETVVFKGINGYAENGTDVDGWFVGVVVDKDTSGKPIIVPINGAASGGKTNTIPSIALNTVVLRGLRTASEEQIRTAPLVATPVQKTQYMQKSLMEVKETTDFILNQEIADVKWGKSEITDFAIFEHKLTAETDILLGKKKRIPVANKYNEGQVEETFFQEGIYWQAGKDHSLPTSATKSDLVTMMKTAFVGNASSNTKMLFAGSSVIETLSKVEYDQVIYPGKPGQVFGLDVQKIIYGQYTLLICAEPAFDDLQMPGYGLIIDDQYLYKYTRGWETINLDNKKLGTGDSQSQIFIDNFGFVLKNAKAHTRVKLV